MAAASHDIATGDIGTVAAPSPRRPRRPGPGIRPAVHSRSSLTRKVVAINLVAILLLVVGVLSLDPSRRSLELQWRSAAIDEVRLLATLLEARLDAAASTAGDPLAVAVASLPVAEDRRLTVFDAGGRLVAARDGAGTLAGDAPGNPDGPAGDVLARAAEIVRRFDPLAGPGGPAPDLQAAARDAARSVLDGREPLADPRAYDAGSGFVVAAPFGAAGEPAGVAVLASGSEEIDRLVRAGRQHVLRMFLIAIVVSIGLSVVLASTISSPLAELAAAVEIGRRRNHEPGSEGSSRVNLPDLSARTDEIGRLSGALGGMVSALYDRIESNEQFAADVAHEIKNPLASLRSAVGSLRLVKKEEHRARLLDVVEHDVRRLDRLVSDISNASRLDSELVKEEEETFDLLRMLTNISDHLGREAGERGVEFIADLPDDAILIEGLESRLAQVFVNLLTNAISFCEEGDAIRLWARRRANRVLVVVEDTGPGIPSAALQKIFDRFYSERPAGQFGDNSGLGLSISKQIVEAHGGVIWAENIEPTEADPTSDPLGARLVVGLPV